MSVAKTGAIPNSYRQIHIAVDDFENRILKGRINHESKEYGIVFYSLSEMVFALEELFEEIHYPMKSVDHRNFSKKEYLDQDISAYSITFPNKFVFHLTLLSHHT